MKIRIHRHNWGGGKRQAADSASRDSLPALSDRCSDVQHRSIFKLLLQDADGANLEAHSTRCALMETLRAMAAGCIEPSVSVHSALVVSSDARYSGRRHRSRHQTISLAIRRRLACSINNRSPICVARNDCKLPRRTFCRGSKKTERGDPAGLMSLTNPRRLR